MVPQEGAHDPLLHFQTGEIKEMPAKVENAIHQVCHGGVKQEELVCNKRPNQKVKADFLDKRINKSMRQ